MVASKPIVRGPIDGNAFAIMGAVSKALRRAGQGEVVDEFLRRAMEGDYNHLLQVAGDYVEFEL